MAGDTDTIVRSKRCDRCGGKAAVRAQQEQDKRKIYLCSKHLPMHEEALKKQKFVLTDL